jgi:predicted transcriptional regulator of viral defense system
MDKVSILIQQQQRLFHTSDLKVLWGISNQSTLYQTIYRLVKKGTLIRVHKGLYSVIPLSQIDPIEIGFRVITRFSYLSTESVLSKNGIINQSPSKITFISGSPAHFDINGNTYLVRQLKPQCLNNTLGISQNDNGVFVATTERAIADMLYVQPNYHFDANSIIDWNLVKSYQQQINYI